MASDAISEPEYIPVKAPRGNALSCKGWPQEAALRMLMNSLDPEVVDQAGGRNAEKAEYDWKGFHATVSALKALADDETLLVQSDAPAGVFSTHVLPTQVLPTRVFPANVFPTNAFHTHKVAPRVVISGSRSWTQIGAQAAVQESFEVFAAAARKHGDGELEGKLIVSGGLGTRGAALPLAATMNGAAFLGIEVAAERIKRCLRSGYCDFMVNSLDEALRILKNSIRKKENVSVGLVGNCAEVIPELASRGVVPDILTDQTPAHDPVNAYVPQGLTLEDAEEIRQSDPAGYRERALDSVARQVEGMLALRKMGSTAFEYGNNLRHLARERGVAAAFDMPGFMEEYIHPMLLEGKLPMRWVALSGEAADIAAMDAMALAMFPENLVLTRWIGMARRRIRFQGLPARSCSLGNGERVRFGIAVNDLVRQGKIKAPVVIALEGMTIEGTFMQAAASPYGERGKISGEILDAPATAADGPALKALLDAARGASLIWAGGLSDVWTDRGIENFRHFSQAVVADGSAEMAQHIERMLSKDARTGSGIESSGIKNHG
ncbi:MAG TPA: urocanate hydratase [Terriglobales bacterium]|nr:urocanate hydratase [Terriglobales bacterium]